MRKIIIKLFIGIMSKFPQYQTCVEAKSIAEDVLRHGEDESDKI